MSNTPADCQYVKPVSPENRVSRVEKMEDGRMWVQLYSGKQFFIAAEDTIMQAWVIHTVINRE